MKKLPKKMAVTGILGAVGAVALALTLGVAAAAPLAVVSVMICVAAALSARSVAACGVHMVGNNTARRAASCATRELICIHPDGRTHTVKWGNSSYGRGYAAAGGLRPKKSILIVPADGPANQ